MELTREAIEFSEREGARHGSAPPSRVDKFRTVRSTARRSPRRHLAPLHGVRLRGVRDDGRQPRPAGGQRHRAGQPRRRLVRADGAGGARRARDHLRVQHRDDPTTWRRTRAGDVLAAKTRWSLSIVLAVGLAACVLLPGREASCRATASRTRTAIRHRRSRTVDVPRGRGTAVYLGARDVRARRRRDPAPHGRRDHRARGRPRAGDRDRLPPRAPRRARRARVAAGSGLAIQQTVVRDDNIPLDPWLASWSSAPTRSVRTASGAWPGARDELSRHRGRSRRSSRARARKSAISAASASPDGSAPDSSSQSSESARCSSLPTYAPASESLATACDTWST